MSEKPTEAPTTLRELADHLGLAVSTVSRTLSGQGDRYRIGKATQERVQEAAKQYGVRPNPAARGLRLKRTLTIGVILPDITNPFFASFARAVERGAAERDYMAILCDTADDPKIEQRALRQMRERLADALIVCPASGSPEGFRPLLHSGTPLIFVDRFFEDLPVASVVTDDYEAGREVAKIFAERGHQRIGCLAGNPDTSSSQQRSAGFRRGLNEAGIDWDETLTAGKAYSVSDGYESARHLLEYSDPPTGLFCYANVNALGALQALGEKGLRIPQDISLVSFDDQPFAGVLATPLSAMVQDTNRLAEEALNLAFSELEQPGSQAGVRLEVSAHFVDRESVSNITP